MDKNTINGKTFKLFKKGTSTKIAAAVGYDASTDTATLNPFDPTTTSLAGNTTYKAVVTTGATDSVGNHLPQNYKWFFTTAK